MVSGRSQLLLLVAVLLLLLAVDRSGRAVRVTSPTSTASPFNLDEDHGLRAAVAAVGSELVLLTTNAGGLTSAANMALQLRRVGLTAVLVLADRRRTCATAHATWPWLCCGWSRGLGTFERYRDAPSVSREERLLWALWSAKWLTVARRARPPRTLRDAQSGWAGLQGHRASAPTSPEMQAGAPAWS